MAVLSTLPKLQALALLMVSFCYCSQLQAVTQTQIRSVPLAPVASGANRCANLFRVPSYELQVVRSNPLHDGLGDSVVETKLATERSQITIEWIERVLEEWFRSGHYTQEQIEFLRQREINLAPERTFYFSTDYTGRITGMRIFDGSNFPILKSITWGHIYAKDPRTPIEKQYSYRYPERDQRENSYIWEIGLLSSPDFFHDGVNANFVQMARLLDANYNMNVMGAYGSTAQVEKLNFAIYGLSREKLVPHYEALGFERVIDQETGSDKIFEDGVYLLRMDGKTLLNNFFWGRSLPETENYSYEISLSGDGSRIQRAQENVQRLEGKSLYVMSPEQAAYSLQVIYDRLASLKNTHDLERASVEESERQRGKNGGSPREVRYLGQETPTRQLIEELAVIWRSLPEDYVDYQTWFYMSGQINFMLSMRHPARSVELAISELGRIGVLRP